LVAGVLAEENKTVTVVCTSRLVVVAGWVVVVGAEGRGGVLLLRLSPQHTTTRTGTPTGLTMPHSALQWRRMIQSLERWSGSGQQQGQSDRGRATLPP
jgi:hypothetical protein